jgi:hypothetical protein
MEECLINLNKDEDDERCLKFCYLGIMIDVIIHLLDYLMEPYIYFISVPRMEPSVIDGTVFDLSSRRCISCMVISQGVLLVLYLEYI